MNISLRVCAVLGVVSFAACSSGATIGGAPAPAPARVSSPTASSASPTSAPTSSAPGTNASPSPGASSGGFGATPSPGPTSATLSLACDNAPFPSTTYVDCEATNYAMVSEAPAEQTQPAFVTALAAQSVVNTAQWTQRAANDPSWLSPLSGNTPQTPLCTTFGSMCVGIPFQYPDSAGSYGSTFYTTEASVVPFVVYDSGCARMSGRMWAPASSAPGNALPTIVIENGSIEAPETLYWWAAQNLVLDGYVVLTFDPRGQGRSDEMTPTLQQGGNINTDVFQTGLVDAIDFMHSSPTQPYPNNATCAGTYPTVVTAYNPFWNRIDRNRLGIAGHSAGAAGVSIVQGLGGPGAAAYTGKLDSTNPVKVAVAWDGLLGPAGGQVGGVGSQSTTSDPKFTARVPSMGNSSEYGLAPALFATPPPVELHKQAYAQWVSAGTPVYELTIRGSTHYDFSLIMGFPATSWCPDAASNECTNGWANPVSEYYTLAWFDRWLKNPGEIGYADADARLLNDNGPLGRNRMSFHFHSARSYPDRNGTMHVCGNIRSGCADTGNGTNMKRAR